MASLTLTWRTALAGAICVIILNSATAAVHKHKKTPTAYDRVVAQVNAIEKQAPNMRRIECQDDNGYLFEQLNTCCISTTLYLDGQELRKAVVRSRHGDDGFVMEWYFVNGKPIFVLETGQYQLDEKTVRAAGNRTPYEVCLEETHPEEPDIGPMHHAKNSPLPRLVRCRWQNRYYMYNGVNFHNTTDYPGNGESQMMSISQIHKIAAAILKTLAKS